MSRRHARLLHGNYGHPTAVLALTRMLLGHPNDKEHHRRPRDPPGASHPRLIWLVDGALQFQPYMFAKTFITGVIDPSAVAQPAIIADPITWIANLIAPHVTVFNAFAATLQVAIGLGLLYRRTVKPALVASIVWALGIWFTGEGLGMILTGNASPLTGWPGAALLYVIAGLMCWPRMGKNAAVTTPARRFGLLGERGARCMWAALWLGSAAL
ncbi:MAG TPA: hypothetical protein VG388_03605 [Solirubrobacteraceae bacterium]|nr:hypothetical protein [Solirubrobacteraceae bacterium]